MQTKCLHSLWDSLLQDSEGWAALGPIQAPGNKLTYESEGPEGGTVAGSSGRLGGRHGHRLHVQGAEGAASSVEPRVQGRKESEVVVRRMRGQGAGGGVTKEAAG